MHQWIAPQKQIAVLSEIVIHGGVKHVALEPVPCAFPYFADEQHIRVNLLHRFSECPPEAIVHFTGNIQPPAVDVEILHPIASYLAKYSRTAGFAVFSFGIIRS